MRGFTRGVLAICSLLAILVPSGLESFLHAQQVGSGEPIRVDLIRRNKESYRNEVVTVEGFATQFLERPGQTTSFYFIRDDWGALIQVRTSRALPETNHRYRVTGVIGLDNRLEPYISEEGRVDIDTSRGVQALLLALNVSMEAGRWREAGTLVDSLAVVAPDAPNLPELRARVELGQRSASEIAALERQLAQAEEMGALDEMERIVQEILAQRPENAAALRAQLLVAQRRAEQQRQRLYLWLGAAALLVAVGGWFLLRSRRASTPAAAVGIPAESVATPEPGLTGTDTRDPSTLKQAYQDFKTVQVYRTQRVLPGRLMVDRDGHKEAIPLYADPGSWEVSIGRESPGVTVGIRIKDKTNTVSRTQAAIKYDRESEKFTLVNKAGEGSNPTVVNGKRLKEDEQVPLTHDDRVRMGVLEATFERT